MAVRLASLTLSLLLAGGGAAAAAVLRPDITLPLAGELVDATLAACQAQGRGAAVAVVDRGGNLVALKRADGVGPHNTLAARRKAYTALSAKTPTRVLAERARTDPDSANLSTVPELLLLGGGLPLMSGNEVIGAIGVAGAGGAAMDETCAARAIAALAAKLSIQSTRGVSP
ncbi:heme-binding protein [Massilia sp. CCM 8733]|uniref:Heme-binding protein n=1 Tax=Massilia mucilaginosa TaxID=2609282 RepID=A0ABX0NSR2_9BURK|nr:heme-binding protein [Massilia mucilaginosa]NHZ89837.1 heme-binding protein [Massilia mucilaginosa]